MVAWERMRIRILLGLLLSTVIALSQACVGDDPATSSVPDAGTSSSSSSGTVIADSATGQNADYGVFLTSTVYATDFAKGQPPESLADFTDGLCRTAATAANLAHGERYQAFAASSRGGAGDDLSRLAALRSLDPKGHKWCSISNSSPPAPDCGKALSTIFETPDDFAKGPVNSVLFNELGNALVGENATHFYSGIALDDNLPKVRNCNGWSVREPFGEDGHLDGGVEVGLGYGLASQRAASAAADFHWAASGFQFCVDTLHLSLLCVENPGTP